jgi:hypothetical protein
MVMMYVSVCAFSFSLLYRLLLTDSLLARPNCSEVSISVTAQEEHELNQSSILVSDPRMYMRSNHLVYSRMTTMNLWRKKFSRELRLPESACGVGT